MIKSKRCTRSNFKAALALLFVTGATGALFSACSTGEKAPAYTGGFQILQTRSEPEKIELGGNFIPKEPHQFLAEVKDNRSQIVEVKVRLTNVPMEIPMEYVGGTLWRGHLTDEQLKTLALTGRDVQYRATVVARNDQGDVAVSQTPIVFDVKGPELSATG